MKNILSGLFALLLIIGHTANAQSPVQFYGCKLNEGSSMSDVMVYVDKWNGVLNEIGADQYQAWVMTPQFSSAMNSWDFMWVGAWSDYEAMGKYMQNYSASEEASKVDATWPANCEMHTLWDSRQIREASQ